ncbi:MAG: phosphohistidine phosphatase [Candidatus Kentron sp. G]|nr:MAG: phosphohistidine phosphatase [Candidatus Kentron sp. G]VFN02632.1 MAG: phosphohistidine phosphatase [Candidatus Kentron sp. G]
MGEKDKQAGMFFDRNHLSSIIEEVLRMAQATRELLLLRHAKSDWKRAVGSDFERPLSERGARDAPRVGQWLHRQGPRPDVVLGSPATRARRTACEVCKMLEFPETHIDWEPQIYDATLGTLLAVLGACRQAPVTLLVGHNPGLESLLVYLCGADLEQPADGKLLPTAALARIHLPSEWRALQAGSGRLVSLTRPERP